MKITCTHHAMHQAGGAASLLFVFEDAFSSRAARLGPLEKTAGPWIKKTGWTGKLHRVALIPTASETGPAFILLAGLGKKKDFHPGRLEQAAAAATRTAGHSKVHSLALPALELVPDNALPPPEALRAILRGVAAGAYSFSQFKTSKSKTPAQETDVILAGLRRPGAELQKAMDEGRIVAEIFAEVRDIANLPANEATPSIITQKVRVLARRHGLSFRLLDQAALRHEKCNALLAVAQGSRNPPCVIELTYKGRTRQQAPIVLLGKTITFDSGGISLKPGKGMEWMKFDKCGGMAALAATLAAARLKLDRPVIGMLAIAENMPGGNATRPGDIVRARSGKTIEILNTDAEGRLILADALSLAAEHKPSAIIDLATLTGAVVVALGHAASGLMGNNQNLLDELQHAGKACGDPLWPLPLWPDYRDDIRGQFADIKNIGEGSAGTIIGGIFLREFVPDSIPWAHLDIAGTAWLESTKPYGAVGATLAGAKLLIEWMARKPGR